MIQAAAKVQATGGVRSLAFAPDTPLQLSNGENLTRLTIAFESYGALNAERSNAVLICHSLTGDQFVASSSPITGRPAWWPRMVGPGRPIDTNRFYVICANVLGGSMGTTGPASLAPDGQPYGLRFSPIVVPDMVRAQSMLVEALGIDSLFLVIGAGLGGMQALQWASAYPRRTFACATIASAARQTPQAMALSELGRQAIMADPEWRGGGYLAHGVRPARGLAIARAASQIGNLSEADLRDAFESVAARERFVLDAEFDTESSRQQGSGFITRFDANAYLYLSRAADRFDLAADFGGNLANAFQGGATRHSVFAFSSDWRYPPEAVRAVAQALIAAGADASFIEIDTPKGHDAYLGEEPALEAALTGFIDSAALARGLSLQTGGR